MYIQSTYMQWQSNVNMTISANLEILHRVISGSENQGVFWAGSEWQKLGVVCIYCTLSDSSNPVVPYLLDIFIDLFSELW